MICLGASLNCEQISVVFTATALLSLVLGMIIGTLLEKWGDKT
jgi:hypothetical protein